MRVAGLFPQNFRHHPVQIRSPRYQMPVASVGAVSYTHLDARTELILLTVGLADPEDPENRKNIKASAQKQIPGWLFQRTRIFHLRGGIDYQKLKFKHKTMMKMLSLIHI